MYCLLIPGAGGAIRGSSLGGELWHKWLVAYLHFCLFPGLFYPVVNKLQGVHFRPWLCTESAGDMEVPDDDQGH